jgi:hypothetical protein
MIWDKETITIIGALAVSLLTVLGNLIITLLTKRYEFKKTLYQVVYDSAYKEWEYVTERITMKNLHDISQPKDPSSSIPNHQSEQDEAPVVVSFTDFLLLYSLYMQHLGNKRIREKDIVKFWKEYKRLGTLYIKERERIDE